MPRMSNQEIEYHYFEMFRKDYELPQGSIIQSDKPDIIIDGGRKVGIEITNFYHEDGKLPESEKVQGKARESVVSQAQQLYLANDGKKIELSFAFEKASPIKDQKKLSKAIADMVKSIDGSSSGNVSKAYFKHIPELHTVYLNAQEYDDLKWKNIQCYSGSIIPKDRLEQIIREKEEKSKKYQHCDAYWLLVVVDFLDPAQDTEIILENLEGITSGVFEKILIYKTYFGQVVEINQARSIFDEMISAIYTLNSLAHLYFKMYQAIMSQFVSYFAKEEVTK